MDTVPLSETNVLAAKLALEEMAPRPRSVYWEFQDARATVLFIVEIDFMSEAEAVQSYAQHVETQLKALLPENGAYARWMVVLKNPSGAMVESFCSEWSAL